MQRAVFFFAVVALLGCDNDPPPIPTDAMVMRNDTGPDPMPDGSVPDGGVDDAGPPVDSGPPPDDAGTADAGPAPMVACTLLDSTPLELGVDHSGEQSIVAVAPGTDHFGVAWVQRPAVQDEVRFARLPSGSGDGVRQTLATVGLAFDPDLVRLPDGSWLAGWTDNQNLNFEVMLRSLNASSELGPLVRLTTDAARDSDLALVATGSNTVLAAWVNSNAVAGTAAGFVQAVSGTGTTLGAAAALGVTERLTLVDQPIVSALWSEDGQANLRAINETGFGSAVRRIDTEENVFGAVSSARSGSFASAVFAARVGIRSELRIRPLDADGSPRLAERQVTPPPESGSGPAVASIAGGSVIAYRSTETGVPAARVRLRFMTDNGTNVGHFDVAEATAAGGDVGLAVAGDGRMLVSWWGPDETFEGGTVLHAVRVECSDAF